MRYVKSRQSGGASPGAVTQGEPVLQQMSAQDSFANAGLGVERLDQAQPTCSGHDLIHLGEEAFAVCLLALAGVFEIGKAHSGSWAARSRWSGVFQHI